MPAKKDRANRFVQEQRLHFVVEGLTAGIKVESLVQSLMKLHQLSRRQAERYIAFARKTIADQTQETLQEMQMVMLHRNHYLYQKAVTEQDFTLAVRIQRAQVQMMALMLRYPNYLIPPNEEDSQPFKDLSDEQLKQLEDMLISFQEEIESRQSDKTAEASENEDDEDDPGSTRWEF